MADIATVFYWPPSATETMGLIELLEWRYRAYKRSGASDE
ncbi:GpE family phage tail protein [Providencia manganoxydans]